MSTQFIRIQDKEGWGVYTTGAVRDIINNKQLGYSVAYDPCTHPTPHYDSRLKDRWCELERSYEHKNYIFSFSSYSQMRAWFFNDDLLIALDELGYEIIIAEGEIHEGYTQAIIKRHTMTVVRTCGILEFIKENI
jgi:hypothetical protein